MNFLQYFNSEETWTNLQEICLEINAKQGVKIPKQGGNVYFNKIAKKLPETTTESLQKSIWKRNKRKEKKMEKFYRNIFLKNTKRYLKNGEKFHCV